MERVLCVGAHCDDESFGMLGTLLKHRDAGDEISFVWFTAGRDTYQGALRIGWYLSNHTVFLNWKDQQLDTYPFSTVISEIEERVKSCAPTVVYCPFIGDLNRDHRIVAEATMVACRPYTPGAPKEVWMYAIKGTTELGLRDFKVDKTVKIDRAVKLSILRSCYPDELINGREVVDDTEVFERWPK